MLAAIPDFSVLDNCKGNQSAKRTGKSNIMVHSRIEPSTQKGNFALLRTLAARNLR
jgi:hypothetical protein